MVITTWYVRGNVPAHEFIHEVYKKNPSFFTLEIHHGGIFTKYPDRSYVNGKVSYVDCVDGDQFSVLELNAMLQELGYKNPIPMWYHFKAPDSDLDYGLHALGNDQDVRFLFKYVANYKFLEVYIEEWKTTLKTYTKASPHRVVIEELDDDPVVPPQPERKKVRKDIPCKKTLFTDETDHGQGSGQVKEIATNVEQDTRQVYEAYVPQFDQGQGSGEVGNIATNVEQDSGQVNENAPNLPVFSDDFMNEVFFSDTGAGLNVGEGEQHGQNTGLNVDVHENEDLHDSGSDSGSDSGEESDSDFADDDHRINEVEVDMTDFVDNVDGDVEWVPHREENPNEGLNDVEVEKVNYDNIDSESDSQDDARTEALRRLRREQNTNPEKKVTFYPGQPFGTKQQIKEMITLLSIETRRHLKIVKNDKTRFRVCCEGIIPVFSAQVGNVGSSQQNIESSQQVGSSGSVGLDVGPPGVNSGYVPIQSPKGIRFTKKKSKEQDKEREKAVIDKCPWTLHASKSRVDETWVVKTFKDQHKCLQARELKRCTSEFLAKQIQEQLHPDSKLQASHLRDQIQQKFAIGFSRYKIYRAKRKAKDRVMGDVNHQYAILRDYILELQLANPGSTVKLDFEPEPNPNVQTREFRRIYVCLGSLKEAFKAGGRDLLGLDGTFMKGLATGQLLLAVGIDPNNGTFPLAYGIVESENKASWTWFLELLGEDLDLNHMSNFTFISDRQKGIIPAIAQLFPCAEHRYCLKHIYDNMKLTFRGQVYKDFLWKCATATTVPEFNKAMEDLKKVNNSAYDWLKAIPPRHWSRSHFSGRSHCDVLLNNMCETVNGKLVDGREKPIIMCLEFVREYMMKRHAKVQKLIETAVGPLTPNATKMFDSIKKEAERYKVSWNGGTKFQVAGPWQDQCVVDMSDRSCTCRKWDLTGMPCKHDVATFNDMANNQMEVGIPESYVHHTYWLATWRTMYSYTIGPTRGRAFWPKFESPITLLPPKHKVSIGRPKKKRRRSAVEIQLVKEGKLTRAAAFTKCGNCNQLGHNKRTCTKAPRQQVSKDGASSSRPAASSKFGRQKTAANQKTTN